MMDSHSDLVAHLKEQLRWAQQEQSAQANSKRHAVPLYSVGNKVWISTVNWSTPRQSKKLTDRWAGPYVVKRVIHDGRAYELDLPEEMIRNGTFPIFHPKLLRPAATDALPDQAPARPVPVEVVNSDGDAHTEWLVDEFVDVASLKASKVKGRWAYKIKWSDFPKATWHDAADYLDYYDAKLFHWKHLDKPTPPRLRMPPNWTPLPEDAGDFQDQYASGDENQRESSKAHVRDSGGASKVAPSRQTSPLWMHVSPHLSTTAAVGLRIGALLRSAALQDAFPI
jgi:hypothetical protein